jgi:hypothetical protein
MVVQESSTFLFKVNLLIYKIQKEHYMLDNPDWKYDQVPEIMDGKNIADYVDADILQRLEDLEREEEMMREN